MSRGPAKPRKTRAKAREIDCAVRLPIDVIRQCQHIADVAGVAANDVIKIALATWLIRERGPEERRRA